MRILSSNLENTEEAFDNVREYLHSFEFVLGGNWNYHHGYFDRYLDEAHKVWLRIPFQVTAGTLDGDTEATDAIVKMGRPFVLKHVYNEGLDNEAEPKTYGALFDQFQDPLNKDAEIEEQWIQQADELLKEVENKWLH